MTLHELKSKRLLHIEDNIDFRTHADVMRLFGKDGKNFQPSLLKHPFNSDLKIWFPKFYDEDNNDWHNTATKDYSRIFERKLEGNQQYIENLINDLDRHNRILFASLREGTRKFYKFKGVFRLDIETSSKNNKAVFDRIAESVELYPV